MQAKKLYGRVYDLNSRRKYEIDPTTKEKKINEWHEHIKETASKHGLSYGGAIYLASSTWEEKKKSKGLVFRDRSKKEPTAPERPIHQHEAPRPQKKSQSNYAVDMSEDDQNQDAPHPSKAARQRKNPNPQKLQQRKNNKRYRNAHEDNDDYDSDHSRGNQNIPSDASYQPPPRKRVRKNVQPSIQPSKPQMREGSKPPLSQAPPRKRKTPTTPQKVYRSNDDYDVYDEDARQEGRLPVKPRSAPHHPTTPSKRQKKQPLPPQHPYKSYGEDEAMNWDNYDSGLDDEAQEALDNERIGNGLGNTIRKKNKISRAP